MPSQAFETIIKEKKKAKKSILKDHNFPSSVKNICLINVADESVRNFLIDGLESLSIGCLIVGDVTCKNNRNVSHVKLLKKEHLYGADFFIHDNETSDLDVMKLLSHGIVPVMPEDNNFASILKQFNPIAFSGNSFLYGKKDKFAIFASVVGLLENMKFPADHKMLLKNVCKIN